MKLRRVSQGALVAAGLLALLAPSVSAQSAGPTTRTSPATAATQVAHVRIVDNYTHGDVRVSINGVTHRVHNHQRTKFFSITPDPHGNDGITLRVVHHTGCGVAKIDGYFKAGRSYRVVVYPHGYHCTFGGGRVKGPDARVVEVR
jgi:hypothetical protein